MAEKKIANLIQRNLAHFSDILLEGTLNKRSKISKEVPKGQIHPQKNLPANMVANKMKRAGQKNSGSSKESIK